MTKSYYHATPSENLESILSGGLLKGIDGCVYLAETVEDSAKFLIIRGYKNISVVEVLLEEDLIDESFDHSNSFFKCRAYVYYDDIPITEFGNIYEVNLKIPGHSTN